MKKKDLILDKGFIFHNHYELVESDNKEKAILKVKLSEEGINPYGVAHGGLIFGLGDTAMGLVAMNTGRSAVTLNSTINYLKPAIGEYLFAKAELIKNGKTTCYLRCDLYNDKDVLVATMDGNYYFID